MDNIPIWKKLNLTVEEAVEYSHIGQHKIRELIAEPDCDFILRVGTKKVLIKRKEFEEYISNRLVI